MTNPIERARAVAKALGISVDAAYVEMAKLEKEGLCIVPRGALEGALHDIEDGQLEGAILMLRKMLAAFSKEKE